MNLQKLVASLLLVIICLLISPQPVRASYFVVQPYCDPVSCVQYAAVYIGLPGYAAIEMEAGFNTDEVFFNGQYIPIIASVGQYIDAPTGCNDLSELEAWATSDQELDPDGIGGWQSWIAAYAECSGGSCFYGGSEVIYGDEPDTILPYSWGVPYC